ncbi:MAG: M14 family zinc carboxypeptidase [Spirochaetota bacterium]
MIPVRISAAIHGDEELGMELALALLEKACSENPPELAGLDLHVVPVANPYGYQHTGSYRIVMPWDYLGTTNRQRAVKAFVASFLVIRILVRRPGPR